MESHKAKALRVLFKHEGSEPPSFSAFREEIENKTVAKLRTRPFFFHKVDILGP